jgi:hypothetical protein
VPTGVAATVQSDRVECEDERVGKFAVAYTDGVEVSGHIVEGEGS